MRSERTTLRNAEIVTRYRQGALIEALALEYEISERSVEELVKRDNIRPPRHLFGGHGRVRRKGLLT